MKRAQGFRALIGAVGAVALAVTVWTPFGPARAATAPEQKNMRVIAQNDLGGHGNGGEGFGEVKTATGRRILYVAHESGPRCFSVVDVTKQADPVLLSQTDVPDADTRCNSLDVSGRLLVVANQTTNAGEPNAGLRIYDISDPVHPRQVGFFDASGPYSRGAHYVWMDDGRYAYLSTGLPDFHPRRPGLDDQIFAVVDLLNPAKPKLVGDWWYPGTRVGDKAPLPTPNADDQGCRVHNIDVVDRTPGRAYVGYIDCGLVELDISDLHHPKPIAMTDDSPPEVGFTHTVWPFDGGRYLFVTHESVVDKCADYPKRDTIWANHGTRGLQQVATVPFPADVADLCKRDGRFGAHNVFEAADDEPVWHSDRIMLASFFNGGVRAYDVSDPARPREVAYAIPPAPSGGDLNAVQINDVYVDDRGTIFAGDRFSGGLYVLRSPYVRGR